MGAMVLLWARTCSGLQFRCKPNSLLKKIVFSYFVLIALLSKYCKVKAAAGPFFGNHKLQTDGTFQLKTHPRLYNS
jgi:hypothetical protein